MKRFAAAALTVSLLLAGCTDSTSSPETSVTKPSLPASTHPTVAPSTTTASPTPTFELEQPPVFTEFESSTACDPAAEDANLQVVQAFVTAYNARDQSRLAELVSSNPLFITDMSGIPHLGEDNWTDIGTWAEAGWSVDDRFELTRLVMYDGGSVFEVQRSNAVLRSNGIERLSHSWKAHSFNCVISHMVLYLPLGNVESPECRYWEVFADALAEGTTQSIEEPETCSG